MKAVRAVTNRTNPMDSDYMGWQPRARHLNRLFMQASELGMILLEPADQQEESDDMPVIDWLAQKAIMAHLFLIYHQSRITSGQPRMIPGFCGYAMN
jgi:hypothetical protein